MLFHFHLYSRLQQVAQVGHILRQLLQALLGGCAVAHGRLEPAFDEHPQALAIAHMAFPQLAQALEHQLRIGLRGAEAVAGFHRAADHLA
ncbi:hypothetical protein D3C85_1511930 [compost metagenome]